MVATLCGRQAVSDEDLVEAFLEYISENESQELRAVLAMSDQGELAGESCEFLQDFFSDYQVTKRPLASNLKATLVQVAKNELLSKPAMAMDGMREGLRDGDFENLWNCSKEDVTKMYHTMQLTPQRVIAMLAEEPSTHLNKSRAKNFLLPEEIHKVPQPYGAWSISSLRHWQSCISCRVYQGDVSC